MSKFFNVLSILIFVCSGAFAQPQTEVSYTDDFQSYGTQKNPTGWVDSSVGNPAPNASGLYKTWPDPLQGNQGSNVVYGTKQSSGNPQGNNPRIGTFSTFTTKAFSGTGRFEYRGRFIRTDATTRIGLTFFSSYPERDSYYLIGLWTPPNSSTLSMQLFAQNAGTLTKITNSGFSPAVKKWYRFLVQVDSVEGATNIRARFWADGTTEPTTFSIDAADTSATRLTSGRIGIWSAVKGDAYVDDINVKSPVNHAAPTLSFFESGLQLQSSVVTPLDHDAHVDVRVSDATSTLTVTVDGQPYIPLTAITSEGPHTIHAHATNALGSSADAEVQIIVDETPPDVWLLESGQPLPLPLARFNRAPSINITATDRWTGISSLTTSLDGQPYVSNTPIVVEGPHELVVDAIDGVNHHTIVHATIVIDLGPPVVSFYSEGVKLGAAASFKTVPSIEVRVTDSISATTFAATLDAQPWHSLDPVTVDGRHRIVVDALDAAGNPASATLDVLVDRAAPVVAITESGQPLTTDSAFNRDVKPEIAVTDTSATTITALLNGQQYAFATPLTTEGKYTLTATVTDELGWSTTVPSAIFFIDRTAPVVKLMEGENELTDGLSFNPSITPRADIQDTTATTTT
jgi:hypothetical protein